MLAALAAAGADSYTKTVTVLVALAESRFDSDAAQKTSRGVFQQTPPWWETWDGTTEQQALAFLRAFAGVARTGDPVRDAWAVQRWAAPDPAKDLPGFLASAETRNYLRVLPYVAEIIRTGKLPARMP